MQNYICVKIIKAEEMSKNTFLNKFKGIQCFKTDLDGYHVQYPNDDGSVYDSWISKEIFDGAYSVLSNVQVNFLKGLKEVL